MGLPELEGETPGDWRTLVVDKFHRSDEHEDDGKRVSDGAVFSAASIKVRGR
jgi:hypothetical protein